MHSWSWLLACSEPVWLLLVDVCTGVADEDLKDINVLDLPSPSSSDDDRHQQQLRSKKKHKQQQQRQQQGDGQFQGSDLGMDLADDVDQAEAAGGSSRNMQVCGVSWVDGTPVTAQLTTTFQSCILQCRSVQRQLHI